MPSFANIVVSCAAIAAASSTVLAQWPSDPAVNLGVSTRMGEQAQPKAVPTSDGGVWVSWFDNATGGFDVALQRYDANANAMFPADGLLISDRSFSSTQDYDLCVDANNDAYLVFRDTVTPGGNAQIFAHRVTSDGMRPWGAGGLQLTNDTAFHAAPKCAAASDGSVYFGWTNDFDWVLQRVTPGGTTTLGAGAVITDATGGRFSISDLNATLDGDVIALWIREAGGFGSPRHMHANRFDESGARVWAGGDTIVFDGGSLQFGNFPTFVTDGAGGSVFAWYSTALDCFMQRLNADGTERFAHNGLACVIGGGSNIRVSPDVAHNPATDETAVFWTELSGNQAMSGVQGQLFNAAGMRLWGASGATVEPLGAPSRNFVRAEFVDGDAAVAYLDQATPSSGAFVRAARLGAMGAPVWMGSPITASTDSGDKGRLETIVDTNGRLLGVWTDDRADSGDIYAQVINADGTLGGAVMTVCLGDCDGSGAVNFADLVSMLFEFGTPGAPGCDADESGTVNFADLVSALFAFGPCM